MIAVNEVCIETEPTVMAVTILSIIAVTAPATCGAAVPIPRPRFWKLVRMLIVYVLIPVAAFEVEFTIELIAEAIIVEADTEAEATLVKATASAEKTVTRRLARSAADRAWATNAPSPTAARMVAIAKASIPGASGPSFSNATTILSINGVVRAINPMRIARPIPAAIAPAPSMIPPAPARSKPAPRTSIAAPKAAIPTEIRPICGSFQIRGMIASTNSNSATAPPGAKVWTNARPKPSASSPAPRAIAPTPATNAPAPNTNKPSPIAIM